MSGRGLRGLGECGTRASASKSGVACGRRRSTRVTVVGRVCGSTSTRGSLENGYEGTRRPRTGETDNPGSVGFVGASEPDAECEGGRVALQIASDEAAVGDAQPDRAVVGG